MLNAYGWWTVATIALYAGYVLVGAGIILLVLAILGFVHASRLGKVTIPESDEKKEFATANA